MRGSVIMAIVLVVMVILWLVTGSVADQAETAQQQERPTATMKVRVADYEAKTVTREVVVRGELEPLRRVVLRAETEGQVAAIHAEKGSRVARGALLVSLNEDDRQAQLRRAKADLKSKQLLLDGVKRLNAQGLQARTQLKAAEADLAVARAELERLQIDLTRTRITSPFDGLLESRNVELGSLLRVGDAIAEVVDPAGVKAIGYVPQQSAGRLELGQPVSIELLDGRRYRGVLGYIAPVAEVATRSFRVEVELPNEDGRLRPGVSADLRIAVAEELAHFLSPALLTLDQRGRVGIKAVIDRSHIKFYPIELIKNEVDGVWVSGLPPTLSIVTLGQGFVDEGERVEPIPGE